VNPLVKVLRLVDGDAKLAMPIFVKQWIKLKRKLLKISKSKKQGIKKFGKLLIVGIIYNYTGLSCKKLCILISIK